MVLSSIQKQQPGLKPIQTKLTVGSPNDRYAKEADAMADRIMRMPQQSFSKQPLGNAGTSIQRKCAACAHEDEQIRRKPVKPRMRRSRLFGSVPEQACQALNPSEDLVGRRSESDTSRTGTRRGGGLLAGQI